MSDILLDFPINGTPQKIFRAISSPQGLDAWWTKESTGEPKQGSEYKLWFGPEYDWRAVVSRCTPNKEFELQLSSADKDWQGSRVGFQLSEKNKITQIRFHHVGWPEINDHFRTSSYCWAMYLRLLKRYVETGEIVEYERRLDV